MSTFGEIRFRLSKLCTGTDPDTLDGAINDAYQSILGRVNWKLLEAEGRIYTVAPYETGTVALTAGSLAITGTGTTWTEDMIGYGFFVSGRNESYRFNFIDATHGALDRAYEGGTSATAGYKLYQDIYELPDDFARPTMARNERALGEIEFRDRGELDRMAPARLILDEPRFYSLVMPGPLLSLDADAENDRKRAQLFPIPLYAAGYPYTYSRTLPKLVDGDTDVPILPWVSEKALVDLARSGILAGKDLNAASYFDKAAEVEISKMLVADAKLRGPQRLRMASRYTRHRIERQIRSSGGGRTLP